ncbi:MAG: hypothetical protein ABJP06_14160 [Sulfitobacter sp.]
MSSSVVGDLIAGGQISGQSYGYSGSYRITESGDALLREIEAGLLPESLSNKVSSIWAKVKPHPIISFLIACGVLVASIFGILSASVVCPLIPFVPPSIFEKCVDFEVGEFE